MGLAHGEQWRTAGRREMAGGGQIQPKLYHSALSRPGQPIPPYAIISCESGATAGLPPSRGYPYAR